MTTFSLGCKRQPLTCVTILRLFPRPPDRENPIYGRRYAATPLTTSLPTTSSVVDELEASGDVRMPGVGRWSLALRHERRPDGRRRGAPTVRRPLPAAGDSRPLQDAPKGMSAAAGKGGRRISSWTTRIERVAHTRSQSLGSEDLLHPGVLASGRRDLRSPDVSGARAVELIARLERATRL